MPLPACVNANQGIQFISLKFTSLCLSQSEGQFLVFISVRHYQQFEVLEKINNHGAIDFLN